MGRPQGGRSGVPKVYGCGQMRPVRWARHTFIRAGRPATNGAVERVQRTILEECWRPAFARSLVPKLNGLSRDLPAISASTTRSAPTGRLIRGRTPQEALWGRAR